MYKKPKFSGYKKIHKRCENLNQSYTKTNTSHDKSIKKYLAVSSHFNWLNIYIYIVDMYIKQSNPKQYSMFITKLLCKYFGNWWTERMQKDSFLDQGKTETITYRIVKKLKILHCWWKSIWNFYFKFVVKKYFHLNLHWKTVNF